MSTLKRTFETPLNGHEETKTATIIGAGFSGITVAVHQINAYLDAYTQDQNIPALTLRLIDKSGTQGPGLPYSDAQNILLLNQPAYAMSPLPAQPDHFTNWRKENGYGTSPHDFAGRGEYGIYLTELFQDAVTRAARSNAPLKIETVKTTVTKLELSATQQDRVTCSDGTAYDSDATIIADGHQRRSLLSDLGTHPRFFEAPFSTNKLPAQLLQIRDKDIAVIGTSQSMLDALAILDHAGFSGTIYAFSREQVLPWAFHPERYGEEAGLPIYDPTHFRYENIAVRNKPSAGDLIDLLKDELTAAHAQGYDTGHVVTSALLYDEIKKLERHEELSTSCKKLRKYVAKLYGNPTPPERYDLLQDYLKRGQLQLVKADINSGAVKPRANGFEVQANGERLEVAAIFNAAAFGRDPLLSPLLQQAEAQNALKWKDREASRLSGGQQAHESLYVVGPAANTGKWGVETFRDHCKETAETCLRQLLQTSSETTNDLTLTSTPNLKL